MAKDGTLRGGTRPGAGTKRKALADKVLEGKDVSNIKLPTPVQLAGEEVPDCDEWLLKQQKDGSTLGADKIFQDTFKWLKSYGCEKLINKQLIEQYAMSVARYIACENAISEYGYLAKHPTTHEPTTSPFVSIANNYLTQANRIWFQMYSIVKENSSTSYGASGVVDPMEALLNKKGK